MSKVEKQSKGLPAIALRFIYFAVALALFVLAGIAVYYAVNTPFTVFGIEGSPTGVADYVGNLLKVFDSGSSPEADAILRLFGFLAVSVYQIVILIIAVVYVIVLVVKLIIYASKNRDKEQLLRAFHSLEQTIVKVLFILFVFDCFIKVAGGVPAKGFVLELVVLPLILVGNSIHKLLVDQFSGEGFDVQKLIYAILEMVFLVGICAAVYFGITKEGFFGDFINEFLLTVKNMSSSKAPSMEFFIYMGGAIVRLVGYFLALSLLKPLIMYYPYNDKKGYEKASFDCTSSLLGKSIAALVLYSISGFVFYYVGKFDSIKDVILAGPLMLAAIMGAAICLMIAHKSNKPAEKEEEEKEEKPEESSEEEAPEEAEEPAEKPAKKGKK